MEVNIAYSTTSMIESRPEWKFLMYPCWDSRISFKMLRAVVVVASVLNSATIPDDECQSD